MREVEESEATPLPVGGHDTPINPYVMREFNNLNDRINIMRETMQAMYNRLNPAAQFYDWVKETHPDILNQYTSIRELEEVGREVRESGAYAKIMTAVPAVDHEGKVVVKYGNL